MPQNLTDRSSPESSIHLLDVGHQRYGDSILCLIDGKKMLIDGGHAADAAGQPGFSSIPEQLEGFLGHAGPFAIDFLIITHCHSDHIGCLPQLVADGVLVPEWVLAADEQFGFPSDTGGGDNDAVSLQRRRIVAALLEEPFYGASDAELQKFITDAANLSGNYKSMLATLKGRGAKIRRYGRDNIDDLKDEFSACGIKIVGPETKHLEICAKSIMQFEKKNGDTIADLASDSEPMSDGAMYRYMLQRTVSDLEDRVGSGAARNDQSIVVVLEVAGKRLLLPGDMQFAEPEVDGLDIYMQDLRKKVANLGPFDFAKLAHHASYNGLNEDVFSEWGKPANLGYTGGIDRTHPDPGVLKLLKQKARDLTLARTDRNGAISIALSQNKGIKLAIERGRLNDFTPNSDMAPAVVASQSPSASAPVVATTRLTSQDLIEVTARIPNVPTQVTLTIDVSPTHTTSPVRSVSSATPLIPDARNKLNRYDHLEVAPGRSVANLIFIAPREQLAKNIGVAEADQVIAAISAAGGQVVEKIPNSGDPKAVAGSVHAALARKPFQGVVLIGGLDIIPSSRLDVLSPAFRRTVQKGSDADDFIVWNDEVYGDTDGDGIAEIPVSRIPDAKSSDVVFNALRASLTPSSTRFGIRNRARPFAEGIFAMLQGVEALLISEPTTAEGLQPIAGSERDLYFMLHGSKNDGTRFWGEDEDGEGVIAFRISNIPSSLSGMVVAGCCWGALTTDKTALKTPPNEPVSVRTADNSIAVSLLRSGICAFIGCTGSHYSPSEPPYEYLGGPMHKLIWAGYKEGKSPARALFEAKIEYAKDIPHGRTTPEEMAWELKILRQFTCLGLGW